MARWMAREDAAGLLYGAVVSGAVLAAVSAHGDDNAWVGLTTGGVLVVYWLADLYIHALSVRFEGDGRHLLLRLRRAAAHKSSVLKGGLPAIGVYLLAEALGAEPTSATFVALGFSVLLLVVAGYVGALQAGTTGRTALVEGCGAGLFGILIIVAKALLH